MTSKSATAFIIYKKQALLLHRDNKPSILDPNKWSLIGGNVEEGETFDEAVVRVVITPFITPWRTFYHTLEV